MSYDIGVKLTVALVAAAVLALGACNRPTAVHGGSSVRRDAEAADPIVFGEVADFSLVDRNGDTVTRGDLLGRPWVLACIFTTCTGPCPAISANMARLSEELGDIDVVLVSLSVDPEIDTPEVLTEYAERYGADPERWRFLTGEGAAIDELVMRSFFLPLDRQRPGEDFPLGIHVTHSTEVVAIDRAGRIRGYYSGKTEVGLEHLARRLRHLAAERP